MRDGPLFLRGYYLIQTNNMTFAFVIILVRFQTYNFVSTQTDCQNYWEITGHNTRAFQVSETGAIFTKQPLDYDSLQSISFDVIATDGAPPAQQRTATTSVNITILDTNNHPPRFNCSDRDLSSNPYDPDALCFYNLELAANIMTDHEVQRLVAEDTDPVNGNLFWNFLFVFLSSAFSSSHSFRRRFM